MKLARGVTLANWRAFEALGRTPFPHLGPDDRRIWLRWLEKHPQDYEGVWYDIRVGVGRQGVIKEGEDRDEMDNVLLRKRIDVVLERRGHGWVVEVKPVASMSALGQVLVYSYWLPRTWPRELTWHRLVVCEELDYDTAPVFRLLNVRVDVV